MIGPVGHVYPLTPDGQRQAELPTSREKDGIAFQLGEPATLSWEIIRK
jgi:hypothetical protein